MPHVDSIKFSGNLIAGLSLLSTRIMRLAPAAQSQLPSSGSASNIPSPPHKKDGDVIDLLLPPGSLYILSGPLRYDYTHEILGEAGGSSSNDSPYPVCERRISIVLRDKLPT